MRGRRFLTIPGYLLAWLLCVAAAPFYMPLLVLVDLLRGRRAVAVRSAAFLIAFFSCEMLGLAACAGLWLWKLTVRPDEERWQRAHYRLQAWWGSAIFGARESSTGSSRWPSMPAPSWVSTCGARSLSSSARSCG